MGTIECAGEDIRIIMASRVGSDNLVIVLLVVVEAMVLASGRETMMAYLFKDEKSIEEVKLKNVIAGNPLG